MDASRTAVMVVGANLLAVWVAGAAGGRMAPPAGGLSPQAVTDQAIGDAQASLLAAAERLEAHARRVGPPALSRDPFRFGPGSRLSAVSAVARLGGDSASTAAPAVEPRPEPGPDIVLQGMAESTEGEVVVRTAILRAGNELVLAVMGSRVGSRFEVVAITADSVDLEDVVNHERRTYAMK